MAPPELTHLRISRRSVNFLLSTPSGSGRTLLGIDKCFILLKIRPLQSIVLSVKAKGILRIYFVTYFWNHFLELSIVAGKPPGCYELVAWSPAPPPPSPSRTHLPKSLKIFT